MGDPYMSMIARESRFVVVVQLLSRVRLCHPTDCSPPGSSVLHYFLELAQIHVH